MYNREKNFIIDKIFKTSENFLHGNRLYNNIIISLFITATLSLFWDDLLSIWLYST